MEAEFDTVAAWTERVVASLGPEYAIPAACRGSANPRWLTWIADRLDVSPQGHFLDVGAGVGGPSAWLRHNYDVSPVLAEPMLGACGAARRLFGAPVVAAWSQCLPFAPSTFEAAWCLGVLCTTTDKRGLLDEVRRVLTDRGRLGLLVLVRVTAELSAPPDGNDFPTQRTLSQDLEAAGFVVDEMVQARSLPPGNDDWDQKTALVEEALAQRYAERPAWQLAQEQEHRIGRLFETGQIETWLLSAHVRPK